MKTIALNTQQAPPISVPLRFIATAPLFLLLAALALVSGAGNPFADAHSPGLLAATHCITLGFMTMIMMGAMQQILPVVVGSPMPASALVAWLTFLPLTMGALLLPAGFMLGKPALLNLAWPTLGLAFIAFISASLLSIARSPARNATRTSVFLAIMALGGAVTFGMLLAHGYAIGAMLPYARLATAHISLSLGGWVTLLIAGVFYQVVPMFQLTPNYPGWLVKVLAPAMFIVLLGGVLSLLVEPRPRWMAIITQVLFWFLAICFAVTTLALQGKRRRKIADATLDFSRLGMVALLCTALLALTNLFSPAINHLGTASAVLFLLGFAMSLMHGMMYKIVPFLVWFHLFRGGVKNGVPNMKEIIPEAWMWRHLWLHRGTLLFALFAPWWSAAAWLCALGLALQGALLGYMQVISIRVYRLAKKRIEEGSI